MTEGRFAFFQNTACEYFPCHETQHPERFNCLFCYCPLYALGRQCGGNCVYLESGVKSCEHCAFPHYRANYAAVLARFPELAKLAAERRGGDGV